MSYIGVRSSSIRFIPAPCVGSEEITREGALEILVRLAGVLAPDFYRWSGKGPVPLPPCPFERSPSGAVKAQEGYAERLRARALELGHSLSEDEIDGKMPEIYALKPEEQGRFEGVGEWRLPELGEGFIWRPYGRPDSGRFVEVIPLPRGEEPPERAVLWRITWDVGQEPADELAYGDHRREGLRPSSNFIGALLALAGIAGGYSARLALPYASTGGDWNRPYSQADAHLCSPESEPGMQVWRIQHGGPLWEGALRAFLLSDREPVVLAALAHPDAGDVGDDIASLLAREGASEAIREAAAALLAAPAMRGRLHYHYGERPLEEIEGWEQLRCSPDHPDPSGQRCRWCDGSD